jgi:uncharacterized protein YbjT (DUF2867 family)
MKIILTGSLGHISKPLTQELVAQGHSVTVISSNPGRQKEIEALGAVAAIGSLENVAFLKHVFTGADVVYCMIPPGNYHDPHFDIMSYYDKIGNNYAKAILQSGVKRMIHLSSIGGNMNKDNGMLVFHNNVENVLQALPADISITTMRPVAFYYNLYAFLHSIKANGYIASNYGEDDRCPWVSPLDIAAAIAEEINDTTESRKVRYVASEEISCNEIAGILGAALGKPGMQWKLISDEQMLEGLKAAGMNPSFAKGMVDMNHSIHNGKLQEHYYQNRPVLGKTKMTQFAIEFAATYNQQ